MNTVFFSSYSEGSSRGGRATRRPPLRICLSTSRASCCPFKWYVISLPLKLQHLPPPPPQSPPLLAFYYNNISLLRLWLTQLSIPMFQCVFCAQQTTQKPSLSEAFIKLQFSTAVGDVRRFNYVVAVRLTLILRLLPDPIHFCR